MFRTILMLVAVAFAAGCQTTPTEAPRATAGLQPTKGSKVIGEVTFEEIGGGKVRVVANVARLPPNAEFGFHIHEVGDCSSGDGMSAKGHFNPHGKPHGAVPGMERHAGDLPNLKSNKSGHATLQVDVDIITVTPGSASIVNRGLVVHAKPDDYRTQPTGNSGDRIACGVIKAD
ncbi:MAG: superoxide dismutase family protein [Gammaproteobacteria bacterium]|nr:superoxide dismutase family protein [Gammaproteobacteria bacterium]